MRSRKGSFGGLGAQCDSLAPLAGLNLILVAACMLSCVVRDPGPGVPPPPI